MLTSNSCVASRYRCPVMQSIEGCMRLRSVVATHTWIKTMLHFKVTVEVMFGDLGQTLRSAKMSVTSHCYFRAWQEWTNSIYVWMKGLQLRVSFFVNNFHSGVTRGLLLFGRWMLWSSCITMTTPSVMSCGKNRQTDRQLRWIKNLGALLISTALITVSLHSLPHLPPNIQVCPLFPRPLPLLQRQLPSQETAGRDAAECLDAARPQRCLLLVRAAQSESQIHLLRKMY